MALEELNEYCEANDIIAYRLKGEEEKSESSIEIYLDDLKPEVKAKVMKTLDIGEDEENYDLFPLFIIEK